MGIIPWCAGSTVHPSLPCSGPWKADQKDFVSWFPCPIASGWMVQWEPLQEILGGKRVKQSVFLVVSLQGGHSSLRYLPPPTQTSLTLVLVGTLFPHLFWPTFRSEDGIPYHSPGLLPYSVWFPNSVLINRK